MTITRHWRAHSAAATVALIALIATSLGFAALPASALSYEDAQLVVGSPGSPSSGDTVLSGILTELGFTRWRWLTTTLP